MDKRITIMFGSKCVTRTLDVCTVADVLKAPQVTSDPDLQFGDNVLVRSNGVVLNSANPVADGQTLVIEQSQNTKG